MENEPSAENDRLRAAAAAAELVVRRQAAWDSVVLVVAGKYLCNVCRNDFNSPTALKNHQKYHIGYLSCLIRNCYSILETTDDVYNHQYFIHDRKRFRDLITAHEYPTMVEASANQVADHEMLVVYNLPSKILCRMVNVQLKAAPDTDEVFAQVSLLPLKEDESEDEKPPPSPPWFHVHSFCKSLTSSDASTHGGFSVLIRYADECLPQRDGVTNMVYPGAMHSWNSVVPRVLNGSKWSHEEMSLKMVDHIVDSLNLDIDPQCLKKVKDYESNYKFPIQDERISHLLPAVYQDMMGRVHSKKLELVEAVSEEFERTYGMKTQVHAMTEKKKHRRSCYD